MSENKKYLGMEKNVCFGLSWVLFPFAIVTLAVEKDLTTEEKRNLVSSIVVAACATIISIPMRKKEREAWQKANGTRICPSIRSGRGASATATATGSAICGACWGSSTISNL